MAYNITDNDEITINPVSPKHVAFAYNDASQLNVITRYAFDGDDDLVATSALDYDELGRLTGLDHAQGATYLRRYGWTFDAAGRLTRYENSLDGAVDYAYDARGQLVHVL